MHNPAATDTPAPPAGLLVADFFSRGAGYASRRRRGTRDWLVTFTVGGRGVFRMGGRDFACGPGDALLLAPGAPHHYGTDPGAGRWEFYWAHFLPRPAWAEALSWREIAPGLGMISVPDRITRERVAAVFGRLLEVAGSMDPWGERLAENALEEALLWLARAGALGGSDTHDARVAQVAQTLSRRYQEDLSVAELAEQVHLSPSRLAHLFKQAAGVSPIQALLQLRLRQAARLLEFSTLGVAEIAAEVGFDSPFYFSRRFRAQYGVSPRAYRQRSLGERGAPDS
jgi:AraC family transcriptional regulator of arabinose operon